MSEINSSALAFLLDAPMQSWGTSSKFNQRETEAHPSKSGIIGMIAAAMGIDKHAPGEAEAIQGLSKLSFSAYRLAKPGDTLVRRLSDFHTVGGGYNDKISRWEKMSMTRRASGGVNKNAVITHRTYLTNASFICVLEGDGGLLQQASKALENPVWGVWFGRKCNLPAMPLYPVLREDRKEALAVLLDKVNEWKESRKQAMVSLDQQSWSEPRHEEITDGDYFLMDQPVSFKDRVYQSRPIRKKS